MKEVEGHLVLHCDNCPVRLDIGPAHVARGRNRMPSAWVNTGDDRHYCPMCAPHVSIAAFYASNFDEEPQPLI